MLNGNQGLSHACQQGSQLPAGLLFGGKYLIQQDRQRIGSAATVLAHEAPAAHSDEEHPREVRAVLCCGTLYCGMLE